MTMGINCNSLTVFKGWGLFLSFCFLADKLHVNMLYECTQWMTDRHYKWLSNDITND